MSTRFSCRHIVCYISIVTMLFWFISGALSRPYPWHYPDTGSEQYRILKRHPSFWPVASGTLNHAWGIESNGNYSRRCKDNCHFSSSALQTSETDRPIIHSMTNSGLNLMAQLKYWDLEKAEQLPFRDDIFERLFVKVTVILINIALEMLS